MSKETSAVCYSSSKGNWIMYQLCDRIRLSSFKEISLPKICIHLLSWDEASGIYIVTWSLVNLSIVLLDCSCYICWNLTRNQKQFLKLFRLTRFRLLLFLNVDSLSVCACFFSGPWLLLAFWNYKSLYLLKTVQLF